MKYFMKKTCIVLLALLVYVVASPSDVKGNTSTTTSDVDLIGGVLDLAVNAVSNISFGSSSTTLNGSTQTLTASPGTLSTEDSTGTGNGWHVTVEASQFMEVEPSGGYPAGYTEPPRTLPLGSVTLSVYGSSITKVDPLNSSPPPSFTGTEWMLDNGSPVVILDANQDEGMGKFDTDFSADALTLTLDPGKTYVSEYYSSQGQATPYASTITWTIVSGPSQ
jgi:hypothetical protein